MHTERDKAQQLIYLVTVRKNAMAELFWLPPMFASHVQLYYAEQLRDACMQTIFLTTGSSHVRDYCFSVMGHWDQLYDYITTGESSFPFNDSYFSSYFHRTR